MTQDAQRRIQRMGLGKRGSQLAEYALAAGLVAIAVMNMQPYLVRALRDGLVAQSTVILEHNLPPPGTPSQFSSQESYTANTLIDLAAATPEVAVTGRRTGYSQDTRQPTVVMQPTSAYVDREEALRRMQAVVGNDGENIVGFEYDQETGTSLGRLGNRETEAVLMRESDSGGLAMDCGGDCGADVNGVVLFGDGVYGQLTEEMQDQGVLSDIDLATVSPDELEAAIGSVNMAGAGRGRGGMGSLSAANAQAIQSGGDYVKGMYNLLEEVKENDAFMNSLDEDQKKEFEALFGQLEALADGDAGILLAQNPELLNSAIDVASQAHQLVESADPQQTESINAFLEQSGLMASNTPTAFDPKSVTGAMLYIDSVYGMLEGLQENTPFTEGLDEDQKEAFNDVTTLLNAFMQEEGSSLAQSSDLAEAFEAAQAIHQMVKAEPDFQDAQMTTQITGLDQQLADLGTFDAQSVAQSEQYVSAVTTFLQEVNGDEGFRKMLGESGQREQFEDILKQLEDFVQEGSPESALGDMMKLAKSGEDFVQVKAVVTSASIEIDAVLGKESAIGLMGEEQGAGLQDLGKQLSADERSRLEDLSKTMQTALTPGASEEQSQAGREAAETGQALLYMKQISLYVGFFQGDREEGVPDLIGALSSSQKNQLDQLMGDMKDAWKPGARQQTIEKGTIAAGKADALMTQGSLALASAEVERFLADSEDLPEETGTQLTSLNQIMLAATIPGASQDAINLGKAASDKADFLMMPLIGGQQIEQVADVNQALNDALVSGSSQTQETQPPALYLPLAHKGNPAQQQPSPQDDDPEKGTSRRR